jgi:hypothetical protein
MTTTANLLHRITVHTPRARLGAGRTLANRPGAILQLVTLDAVTIGSLTYDPAATGDAWRVEVPGVTPDGEPGKAATEWIAVYSVVGLHLAAHPEHPDPVGEDVPEQVGPSGTYGWRVVPPIIEAGIPGPIVQVVECTGGRWLGTPARYDVETLAGLTARCLAIDAGAGWSLTAEDTTALRTFAATAGQCAQCRSPRSSNRHRRADDLTRAGHPFVARTPRAGA